MKFKFFFIAFWLCAIAVALYAGEKEQAQALRKQVKALRKESKSLRQQADAKDSEADEKDAAADLLFDKLENPGDPDPPDPPNGGVNFAVVAMRMPRVDDETIPVWTMTHAPYQIDKDCDLVIIWLDGREEVLYDAGPNEAAIDPYVSFDGKTVFFALLTDDNPHPRLGERADIYSIDLETRVMTQITHQPDVTSGEHDWQQSLTGKYVRNTGPVPLGDDRIMFTSNLDSPQLKNTDVVPQLWVVDRDGKNLEKIGYLNLHGALHPVPLPDGRYMWCSGEGMGVRSDQWGQWVADPDGRNWGPLVSAFTSNSGLPFPYHFAAALPNNQIVIAQYYKAKMFGTGVLWKFDYTSGFSAPIDRFVPNGITNITPFSFIKDSQNHKEGEAWNNDYPGRWSHPAAAPGGLLATWTGPSPSNQDPSRGGPPQPWGTIAFVPNAVTITGLADFTIVKQSDNFNYIQPQFLGPYRDIHGIDKPAEKPWLPQEQHAELPKGTPYGIIGTDSFYTRESGPRDPDHPEDSWIAQGSDLFGGYTNSVIAYVRILVQELSVNPATVTRSYGNIAPERLKILADIPLRKFHPDGSPILDSNGDPDTSFWAKLPANMAFTFQMLDKDKHVLTMAQTWHMVRPGEVRTDCKGCHAHHKPSTVAFNTTEAFKNPPVDLTLTKPMGVDFETHIKPIFDAHCVECHDADHPTGLDLTKPFNLNRKYGQTQPAVPFQSRISHLFKRVSLPVNHPQHMPNNGTSLTPDEIATIVAWIDTGTQDANSNVDETKPTLHIETPRRRISTPITEIVFGVADSYELESVEASLNGTTLTLPSPVDEVYTIPLSDPVASGEVTVTVVDKSGNQQQVVRSFE